MNEYSIGCLRDVFYIRADKWSVGTEGLKFYQKDKVVAWFTTWDYWKLEEEIK